MYPIKLSEKQIIGLDLYSIKLIEKFNIKEYNRKFIRDILINNKIHFNEIEYNFIMYRFKINLEKQNSIKLLNKILIKNNTYQVNLKCFIK